MKERKTNLGNERKKGKHSSASNWRILAALHLA
jgi:hypothetical protein